MNNLKNTAIIILSAIVLVQAVLLIHFMQRKAGGPAKVRRPAVVAPVIEKKPVPPAPVEREKPVVPVLSKKTIGKIAIVLDDWGYNLKNKDFLTNNDYHLTVSVLPFKPYSTHVAQLAYHGHKDVIVHMPMEPHNKENYGLEEKTLLTTMSAKQITGLLDEAFMTVPYAKGISNHMGSSGTEDKKLMGVVLGYLAKRHLFFLDSLVTAASVGREVARNNRVVYFQRNVFIDNESDHAYIKAQIDKAAVYAGHHGVAVAIGHDRPSTIAVLKEVIPRLQQEGYEFVNLSELKSSL